MPLDNQQELFYWVDEQDKVLGQITRYEAHHGSRKIHRACEIVVTNSLGQILLQKRSMQKDTNPGKWAAAVGGHVTFPANYEEAAQREMLEEIGISLPLIYVGKFLMENPQEREFNAIFTSTCETLPTNFDHDEIDEMRWVSKKELEEYYQQGKLTPMAVRTFQILKYL